MASDHSPSNYRQIKAVALTHCLDGCQFLRIHSGTTLVNEQDPGFLAWAFPHLDPFGIGGFNHMDCCDDKKLSFLCQLQNLLLQDNL